jgi:transposase
MPKHRTYTAEFKFSLVLALLTGTKSRADLCREHKIHPNLLDSWRSQFETKGSTIFERPDTSAADAHIAELERVVGRMTMDLEIQKKALALLPARTGKQ